MRCPTCDQEVPADGWVWRDGLVPSASEYEGAPPGWHVRVWGQTEEWEFEVSGPGYRLSGCGISLRSEARAVALKLARSIWGDNETSQPETT